LRATLNHAGRKRSGPARVGSHPCRSRICARPAGCGHIAAATLIAPLDIRDGGHFVDEPTAKEGLAEREGFEPPIPVKVCPLSRRIVSTTHAPLRAVKFVV